MGANHGFVTCRFAALGAQVLAFGLGERVVANPVAVAATDGHAELLVTDSLGGGMSTLSPEFAARLSLQVRERVSALRTWGRGSAFGAMG